MKRSIQTFIITRFGIAVVMLTVALSAFFIVIQRNVLIEHIDQDLFNLVKIHEYLLPADYHDKIFDEKSVPIDEYNKIVARNNELCTNLNLQYLWSAIEIDGKIRFTSATSPDKITSNNKHAAFFEEHANPESFDKVFRAMKPVVSTFDNQWGSGRMILDPYTDKHGRKYCFGVSLSTKSVNERIMKSIYMAVLLLVSILLVAIPIIYFLSKSIATPIISISQIADNIANERSVEPLDKKQKKWIEIDSIETSIQLMYRKIQSKITALETAKTLLEASQEKLTVKNTQLDKKVAERTQELKKAKELAEQNERFLTSITQQSPDIIYIYDVEKKINIFVNKDFGEVLGFEKGEYSNKSTALITERIHADDLKQFGDETYLATFENEYTLHYEYRIKDAHNNWRWFSGREKEFKREGKHLKEVIGIATDITKQKHAENELIKAKEKAEESDRLKTEFISNMSHEIRTPMNGIIGFTSFLEDPDLTQNKRQQYIKIIKNSGDQLLRVIDDILEISKLETKQVKVVESEVCLNELLLNLFSIFDLKAKENKTPLYLECALPDQDSTIWTDETKLQKILSNLLENALKFTNTGHIQLGYVKNTSFLEIYVKDTGIGINSENHESIFNRFSQEEKKLEQNVGGLGLGLSIAKENTELLNGQIRVESEKGKGATFFVQIPYKPVFQESGNEISAPATNNKKHSYKILLAEDEEINLLYIKTLLTARNHTAVTLYHAENGQKAVHLCRENPDMHLIFMDLKMPNLDGFEATRQIRTFLTETPIVALTAYTSLADKNKALEAGCNDYITKPIDAQIFRKIIDKYLGQ